MDVAQFVTERGESLYRYAYVLTGNRADAQDVVQTALLKAMSHWSKVSGADHPEAYMRRIVTATFLTWKDRPSAREVPVDAALQAEFALPPIADPASGVVRADELARLVRALPPAMRAVVVLRYYVDLDDAAIAEELGISRGSVRSAASRALATLRHHLADHDDDTPVHP